MAEANEADLAEFQSLRHEITTRITLMNTLIVLELAALGAGLTVAARSASVLAGLAAISSFLWLLWIDQSSYTYKAAAYIAIELAPRLSEQARRPVLSWETFLRRVEAGGVQSERALHRGEAIGQRRIVRGGLRADWYAPLLFGLTPPLLLTLYVTGSKAGLAPIVLACLAGGLLWIYTLTRFSDFLHNIRVINKAIMTAGTGLTYDRR